MSEPLTYEQAIAQYIDYDAAIAQAALAGDAGSGHDFTATRFDPATYIKTRLGYDLWSSEYGTSQADIVAHYALVLKQLHERRDYEQGRKQADECMYWQPGQTIQNWISVDAGHNVGKTHSGAAMVSHFFDSFTPSIIYCFAPTYEQINDLLFKEIRTQRAGKNLPGKVLDGEPRMNLSANHFAFGKATNNAHNAGTERAQGQHGEYLMFAIDEAEGVPSFILDAVRSMSSGGIAVVIILRNPRTTTCEAHKLRRQPNVKTFRISCLDHPNVRSDREIVPGSVRRQYVDEMLTGCDVVSEHAPDDYTFEWQGKIYRPSLEFLWRVLGIASSKGTDDTFCPPGRYEAALTREVYSGDDRLFASLGIDCARYGNDNGTAYVRHGGSVWKDWELAKQDGYEYYVKAKATLKKLHGMGVRRVSVRVDAGGGYHSTCCDNLRRDADLRQLFGDFPIHEIHNNGNPRDRDKYADRVTEMYAYAGESLKVLRLKSPSSKLERDLCERKYEYVIKTDTAKTVQGSRPKTRLDLKQLVSKEKFKDDFHESPDDGDGFVLAVFSENLLERPQWRTSSSTSLYR